MRAYKFLASGRVGRFSDFTWPLDGWVESPGPLAACITGVHACRVNHLPDWIDEELWVVELGGVIEESPDMLLAERGRLVSQVDAWSAATAQELADLSARRAQELAVRALRRSGRENAADNVAEAGDLLDLHARALVWSGQADGAAAVASAFAADAAALAHGRRPDTWELGVALAEPAPQQPPAATAANLAYVVAHVAGLDLVGETGDESAYASGFAAERARQVKWLVETLGLE